MDSRFAPEPVALHFSTERILLILVRSGSMEIEQAGLPVTVPAGDGTLCLPETGLRLSFEDPHELFMFKLPSLLVTMADEVDEVVPMRLSESSSVGMLRCDFASDFSDILATTEVLLAPEYISPTRYIWAARLDCAAADLAGTDLADLSVKSIVLKRGFKSTSRFCSAFRSRFNMSPTAYRDGPTQPASLSR